MSEKATSVPGSDTNLSTHDILDACRVCASKALEMTNIFVQDCNILDKILFCTGIQFTKEDNLSQQMCNNCLDDLSVAHRFKTSCILANNSLKLSSPRIKVEVKVKDDVDCEDVELDWDIGDNVELKIEKDENNMDEDVENDDDDGNSNTEWIELKSKSETKKKRGPYKRNGKLKGNYKEEQPKVKKKKVRGPYKKKSKKEDEPPPEDNFNEKYYLKRLRCVPCGLDFESRSLADTHRETEHKGEAAWVCEICGQKFMHRGSLSTHTRSHFPPMFPCQQCSYRAAHKYDLTKHQRIHAGDRPFQCDMCPATFYDASNMNSHIRRSHSKVMKFRCDMCGRGFYDRSKLNRHMDSHNNIKRHECPQCQTAFTRLSYLKTHLRKRHGVVLPPRRPGPPRKNLLVDLPPVEYVKPTLIAVKQDTLPS